MAIFQKSVVEKFLSNLDESVIDSAYERFRPKYNPSLTCIQVDDAAWSTANWTDIDPQHYFSTNCSATNINEQTTNKELLRTTDLLGRETTDNKDEVLFYIYDDGTVERRIVIE